MDNGFYATVIADSKAHAGVTVVEDNKVRGGDAHYLYSGTIQSDGNDEIVANLKIKSYTAVDQSFGTDENSFELSLMGSKTDTGFRLTGYSPSGREIVIDATKIADIDLGF